MSRASSVPEMTRGRMPVFSMIAFRNSLPFSASRVALVATAMISSTPCESARRRNLDITCKAACIASGVRARPSRPPAPSLTISFSRSMTSNDRSGRTRTTIMWREFVPMSMAARRMLCFYYNGPNNDPITMSATRRRSDLLQKRLDQFTGLLHELGEGDVRALHRTRVASRRLREILPVLQLKADLSNRLGRRLKHVTAELGRVRELDVLQTLVGELRESGRYDLQALRRVALALAAEQAQAREKLDERLPLSELQRLGRKLEKVGDDLKGKKPSKGWRWAVEARVTR